MSKLSSVLKKTGIAVAAAAMLVTMGAGTVVTQAKTSLPVYKVYQQPEGQTDGSQCKDSESENYRYRRKSHEKRK